MALLTTAYDPHAGQAAVGQIIELAARVQQQRAIAAKQEAEQFAADQRRAFEFERRQEFERAKLAEEHLRTLADDRRADDRFAFQKQTWHAENDALPSLGTGGTSSPSYSVPAVSGGVEPTAAPAAPAAGGAAPLQTDLPNADEFDGENSTPPMDRPGDEGDASAAPATADSAVADGLLPALPAGTPIQGRAANGAPIAGNQPGFAKSVVADYGGALLPGNVPQVAKPSPGSQVPSLSPPSPAAAATDALKEMQARGLPVTPKTARAAQAAAVAAAVKGSIGSAEKPPKTQVWPDKSLRQYNPQTKGWDIIGEAPKTTTVEELTKGMEFNPAHNTYKNADGAEFFPGVTNGKPSLRPFRPDAHPAKRTWGSDGNVYYFDAQGNPLKPIPDGVKLRDSSRLQTTHVPGEGVYAMHPDGTKSMMIPDGAVPTAKARDKYLEEVELAALAKDELAKEEKALSEKGSKHDWFGVSAESVEKKRAEYKKSEAAVQLIQNQYPQLKPKGAPAAPAGDGSFSSATEVKQAVRDGKLDRDAAREILRSKFGFP